jgi:hypothetical protein
VQILVDLSTLLTTYVGQPVEGMGYAQQALEIADSSGDNLLKAEALRASAGKLYGSSHDIAAASRSLEQALAFAEASNELPEVAACRFYLACAYYWMADIKRSYKASSHGLEFLERCQQPYLLRNAHCWHALLHASQGAWTAAEHAIEHAQSGVDHLTSSLPLAFLHQIQGFLAYHVLD